MQTFDDRQFTAAFNRLMLLTLATVLAICCALVALQLRSQARHDEAQRLQQFKTRALAIDNLIVSVTEHLNVLQSQAQGYFLDPAAEPTRLLAALAEHAPGRYSLDTLPPPYSTETLGNLTGAGDLTQLPTALREELAMALSLGGLLQAVQRNIPNAAWVYYTSAQRFIHIVPWVHSDTARFTDAFYDKPFFQVGLPQHNPAREIRWTPLYVDEYGKGMMVTASKPVYRGDSFLGTVSIDLTLDELRAYVRDFADGTGELMLVNAQGELIAHPSATAASDTEVRRWVDVLPGALAPQVPAWLQTTAAPALAPQRLAGHLLLRSPLQHAPWQLVYLATEPGWLAATLSRSGLVFLVLLGGLTAMLLVTRRLTFREFIHPAESLVRHIHLESAQRASPPGPLPPQWQPWFAEVTKAFEQNRQLLREVDEKNRQLTDLNLSLQRYMPRLVLVLGLQPGCGVTSLGQVLADTLARKPGGRSTVYLEYPDPAPLAQALGLPAGRAVHAHPNGYELWSAYELGQVPASGVASLLMAKLLNRYDHIVIGCTLPVPVAAAAEFADAALEPMLRYAKAVLLLVPPAAAEQPAVRQLARQLQRGLRQERAQVQVLAHPAAAAVPASSSSSSLASASAASAALAPAGAPAGADFIVPLVPGWPGPGAARYSPPPPLAALAAKLVDRVERVNQIAAFIPGTRGVDQAADNQAVVQRTLHYFSQRFGGATSAPAQGAWHSEQAGIVSEGVHLVMSYATEDDLSQHLDEVIDYIKQLKAELGQEAMALEVNRKLMLV
jgi:hypothetical protein